MIIHEGKWDEFQDLRGFYWHDEPPPEIVSDRVRSGTHALRCYLDVKDGNTRDRCELIVNADNDAPPDTQGAIRLEYGKRYFFSISIYVPEDLPVVKSRLTDVLFQMHDKPDPGDSPKNPNLSLEVDSGNDVFRIYTRGDDRKILPDKNYQFSRSFERPLIKGRWVDWEFEMLLSYNDDGVLCIWQDKDLIYEGYHKNCYNDERGPHIAFGCYSWWADNNYGITTHREYWLDNWMLSDEKIIKEDLEKRVTWLEATQQGQDDIIRELEESLNSLSVVQIEQQRKIIELEQAQTEDEKVFADLWVLLRKLSELLGEWK